MTSTVKGSPPHVGDLNPPLDTQTRDGSRMQGSKCPGHDPVATGPSVAVIGSRGGGKECHHGVRECEAGLARSDGEPATSGGAKGLVPIARSGSDMKQS